MMFTTVKGHFGAVTGTIHLDEQDISRSSVEAEIDAASLDTRTEQRDTHLRSQDFLHVEQHPTITFKSTRVERAGEDRFKVAGDLTIRGTTRSVVLDTTLNGRGKTPFGTTVASFEATTTINRKDFGLNWNVALEAGGFLVGDTIKIGIDTEAVLQS
jgi:polyisoprenoid-binding protein YceI